MRRVPPIRGLALLAGLALASAPSSGVSPTSPLTLPALTFVDAYPIERSLLAAIVQGSLSSADVGSRGVAAVHLPQGSLVTGLSVTAVDDNASNDFELQLFRRQIVTNPSFQGEALATIVSDGASPAVGYFSQAITPGSRIDNARYVYWVTALLPEDVSLLGVKVSFLEPVFADGFESGDTAEWSATAPLGRQGAPSAVDRAALSKSESIETQLELVDASYVAPWGVNFADAIPGSTDNGCWYLGSDGGTREAYLAGGAMVGLSCCFVAPVHLPDGVTISSVFFYLHDETSSDLSLSLRRKRIGAAAASAAMASVTSSGSSSSVTILPDVSIAEPVVDNDLYTYFLSSDSCLQAPNHELSFYQALIFYAE